MYCRVCIDHEELISSDPRLKILQKDGNFTSGTDNFRKSAISDHENSKAHRKAAAAAAGKGLAAEKPETTQAGQALLKLKRKERGRLQVLFRNAKFYK